MTAPALQSAVTTGFLDANISAASSVVTSTNVTSSTGGLVTIVVQLAANSSITVNSLTGGGSNWGAFNLVKRSQNGNNDIEIWECTSTGALNGTLTANFSGSALGGYGIWVYCWDANGSKHGINNSSNGATANALVSLTGTRSGSVCVAGFSNWTNTNVPTGWFVNYGGAFTAITNSYTNSGDGGGAGYSEQLLSGDPAVSATITSSTNWAGVAVEVVAATPTTNDAESAGYGESEAVYGPIRFLGQTSFQTNAFQENAFNVAGGTAGAGGPTQTDNGEVEKTALGDTETASQAALAGQQDVVGLSDPQVVGVGTLNAQAESAGGGEAETAGQKATGAESEAAGASEAQTGSQGLSAAESERTGAGEAETATQAAGSAQVESAGAGEIESAVLATWAGQSEAAAGAEAQTSFQGYAATEVEAAGLADSYAVQVQSPAGGSVYDCGQTEGMGAGDTSGAFQGYSAGQIDAAGLADALEARQGYSAGQVDASGLSDFDEGFRLSAGGTQYDCGQMEALGLGEAQAVRQLGPGAPGAVMLWNGSEWVNWENDLWIGIWP